jgi:tetratricopeptide (TPR) repeat protein
MDIRRRLLILFLWTFSSCSYLVEKEVNVLSFNHVVSVKSEKGIQTIYPDDVLKVDSLDKPVLVMAAERVPMLIVPIGTVKGKKIELEKIESAMIKQVSQQKINGVINESISYVFEILDLLDQEKWKKALEQVTLLKLQRPNIAYYYYLEASIHHQLGAPKKALKLLEEGISLYKYDTKASNYLKELLLE